MGEPPVLPLSSEEAASLLRDLNRGIAREERFRQLFEAYYGRVRQGFRRMPPAEREDLTQRVFLRVVSGFGKLPEDFEGFERWLSVVVRNVFRSWWTWSSRQKRRGEVVTMPADGAEVSAALPELEGQLEPAHGTALERLLVEERARLLHEAIGRMPEQMRACIRLRVGQERSNLEIASLLGLAEGTVKAHLHHARERLRSELGSYFQGFEL